VEELEYMSESKYAMPPMADPNRLRLVPLGEVLVVPRVEEVKSRSEEVRDREFVYPVHSVVTVETLCANVGVEHVTPRSGYS